MMHSAANPRFCTVSRASTRSRSIGHDRRSTRFLSGLWLGDVGVARRFRQNAALCQLFRFDSRARDARTAGVFSGRSGCPSLRRPWLRQATGATKTKSHRWRRRCWCCKRERGPPRLWTAAVRRGPRSSGDCWRPRGSSPRRYWSGIWFSCVTRSRNGRWPNGPPRRRGPPTSRPGWRPANYPTNQKRTRRPVNCRMRPMTKPPTSDVLRPPSRRNRAGNRLEKTPSRRSQIGSCRKRLLPAVGRRWR